MSMSSEHKALVFIGAAAVLGAGVRLVRAERGSVAPAVQPALEHQIQASDSAKNAKSQKRGKKARGSARADSSGGSTAAGKRLPRGAGPLDRPGYINGRLDLDVASAAQVDSLPGVTPAVAKRIVADRLQRGPFLSIDGLRRVPGAGPAFIARIDTLVTFSGTLRFPSASDTVIPPRRRAKAKSSARAGARGGAPPPATPPEEPRTPVPR